MVRWAVSQPNRCAHQGREKKYLGKFKGEDSKERREEIRVRSDFATRESGCRAAEQHHQSGVASTKGS
jgi:hypothetical protein